MTGVQTCALPIWTPLPTVLGDETQLTQLLQNLIGNAIKYRHPLRKPVITISVLESNREWLFEFKDNGIGFSNQYNERIFGIFQRLNNDRVTGNGIGLAICKRIIEKQGGRIWAESIENEGSIFSFSIPNKDRNSVYTEGVNLDNVFEKEMA